jgi:hypothetical protein
MAVIRLVPQVSSQPRLSTEAVAFQHVGCLSCVMPRTWILGVVMLGRLRLIAVDVLPVKRALFGSDVALTGLHLPSAGLCQMSASAMVRASTLEVPLGHYHRLAVPV